MGREAHCHARWSGGEGEVKALLEARDLILRGDRRAVWPIASLGEPRVVEDRLELTTPDGPLALSLGAMAAQSWARKIQAPPPTLAEKLGVGLANPVQVIGEFDDLALEAAVAGALAPAGEARTSLAVVKSPADLDAALQAHATLPADAPIWIVNVKGAKSPFGENAVRAAMRAKGFMDNKTASVSDRLAATRYARPRS
jgi:hypothetical protein